MNCQDIATPSVTGRIRIFEEKNPDNVILDEKNLILNGTSWLFSRLMCNFNTTPVSHGIWGLAVGSGDSAWDSAGSLVDPLVTDYALIAPFPVPGPGRIALSTTHFVDSTGLAVPWSTTVDYQTNISTTIYPALKGEAIRELGLIGGVDTTNFLGPTKDSFFNPSKAAAGDSSTNDYAILVNSKRFQGLVLPDGVNFIISWQLAF